MTSDSVILSDSNLNCISENKDKNNYFSAEAQFDINCVDDQLQNWKTPEIWKVFPVGEVQHKKN